MMKTKYSQQIILIGFLLISVTNIFGQSVKCPLVKNISSIITECYPSHFVNGQPVKSSKAAIEIKEEKFDKNGLLVSTKNSSKYDGDSYITIWTYAYSDGELTSIKEESKINNSIIPEDTKEKVVRSTNANGLPKLITNKMNTVKWIYTYKGCIKSTINYTVIDSNEPGLITELKYNQDNELIERESTNNLFGHKSTKKTYSHYKYNEKNNWVERIVTDNDGFHKLETRQISY